MDISRPEWASESEWIDWCNRTPFGVLKRGAELESVLRERAETMTLVDTRHRRRIAELKAENKRLREALAEVAPLVQGANFSEDRYPVASRVLQEVDE